MDIDRAGPVAFLRRRRESMQPEDVGLPRGQRRRTDGLRREEVALLGHMSTDYYARPERERGPHPSDQMLASIVQGPHGNDTGAAVQSGRRTGQRELRQAATALGDRRPIDH